MSAAKSFGILLALGLAGCGYRAPPQTDTSNPAFIAARDKCEDTSAAAVNKTNAKTGLAWFGSPFTRWSQIADATQSCMAGDGYGRVRWCTPEELRTGNRQGTTIVTASGVQCVDRPVPPSARPADTSPPEPAPPKKAPKRTS